MVLLELFTVFMKIGYTSFGGMSMIPVINQEMISHGWMTAEDVANILAIAEMTPGPLGINCATFAGMQVFGVLGGLVAVLGVLMPAFTTTLMAAIFYQKFKETKFMGNILYVIRPVCIGLMMAVICSLSVTAYLIASGNLGVIATSDVSISSKLAELLAMLDWKNIAVGITSAYLLIKKEKGVMFVICVAAVMGLCLNLVF